MALTAYRVRVESFIVYSFNSALGDIINESCSHGPACPMWGTLNFQTNVGIGIMVFVIMIGLYLIFFGKEEVPKEHITRYEEIVKLLKENFRLKRKSNLLCLLTT